MDFAEKFKAFTIHTAMCRGGISYINFFHRIKENLTSHPCGGWAVQTPEPLQPATPLLVPHTPNLNSLTPPITKI